MCTLGVLSLTNNPMLQETNNPRDVLNALQISKHADSKLTLAYGRIIFWQKLSKRAGHKGLLMYLAESVQIFPSTWLNIPRHCCWRTWCCSNSKMFWRCQQTSANALIWFLGLHINKDEQLACRILRDGTFDKYGRTYWDHVLVFLQFLFGSYREPESKVEQLPETIMIYWPNFLAIPSSRSLAVRLLRLYTYPVKYSSVAVTSSTFADESISLIVLLWWFRSWYFDKHTCFRMSFNRQPRQRLWLYHRQPVT